MLKHHPPVRDTSASEAASGFAMLELDLPGRHTIRFKLITDRPGFQEAGANNFNGPSERSISPAGSS